MLSRTVIDRRRVVRTITAGLGVGTVLSALPGTAGADEDLGDLVVEDSDLTVSESVAVGSVRITNGGTETTSVVVELTRVDSPVITAETLSNADTDTDEFDIEPGERTQSVVQTTVSNTTDYVSLDVNGESIEAVSLSDADE